MPPIRSGCFTAEAFTFSFYIFFVIVASVRLFECTAAGFFIVFFLSVSTCHVYSLLFASYFRYGWFFSLCTSFRYVAGGEHTLQGTRYVRLLFKIIRRLKTDRNFEIPEYSVEMCVQNLCEKEIIMKPSLYVSSFSPSKNQMNIFALNLNYRIV